MERGSVGERLTYVHLIEGKQRVRNGEMEGNFRCGCHIDRFVYSETAGEERT